MTPTVTAAKSKEAADITLDPRRHYELMLIISPTLGDQEKEKTIEEWQKTLEQEGGQITQTEKIGRRELAYSIHHHQYGYYLYYHFLLDPSKQKAIKKKLMVDTRLLRFLLVEIPAQYKVEIFDRDIIYGGAAADDSAVAQELAKQRKQGRKAGQAKEALAPVVAVPEATKEMAGAVVPPITVSPALEEAASTAPTVTAPTAAAPEATPSAVPTPSREDLIKEEHEGAETEAKRLADLDKKLKELLG